MDEYGFVAYADEKEVTKLGLCKFIVQKSRKRKRRKVSYRWQKLQHDQVVDYCDNGDVESCHPTAIASNGYLTHERQVSKDMVRQVFENKYCSERWSKQEILNEMLPFLTQIQSQQFKADFLPVPKFECGICMDDSEHVIVCKSCKQIVCEPCFTNTMKTLMSQNEREPRVVKCVSPNCEARQLRKDDVSCWSLIDSETYDKYSMHLVLLSGYVKCKKKDCCGMFIPQEIMVCAYCSTRHCSKCYEIDGHSVCNIKDIDITEEMAKLGVKKCPGCKVLYSRSYGCNGMKCANCTKIFCDACGFSSQDTDITYDNHNLLFDKSRFPHHLCDMFPPIL